MPTFHQEKVMKRFRHVRRGLTLLELMIVLIILVGLLAIVGPRLLGSQKKADIRTAMVQIEGIASALDMYYTDMKSYPSTEDGLNALLSAPEDERKARNWSGPYLDEKKIPLDPWGNEYGYEFDTEGEADKPRIFSNGPDGEADTDDDISNQPKAGEGEGEEQSSNSDADKK